MIIFVTNRKDHNVESLYEKLNIFNEEDGLYYFKEKMISSFDKEGKVVGFDTENTGLDPYLSKPLLAIFGDRESQLVVDVSSVDVKRFYNLVYKDHTFLGQNLSYDYKIVKVAHGIELRNMYDVMIVDQRLFQNCNYKFNLPSIVFRHTGSIPPDMDKNIRKEFIGANPDTFIFKTRHILYAAGDVSELFIVRDRQMQSVKKLNLEFLINEIELLLIEHVADLELEGVEISEEKWTSIYKRNIQRRFEAQIRLDDEFRRLREVYCKPTEKIQIMGGMYDRKRREPVKVERNGLFGEELGDKEIFGKKDVKLESSFMNWNSDVFVLNCFAWFSQECPTKGDEYKIPLIDDKKRITNKKEGFTTQRGALEAMLRERLDHPMLKFIELLLEVRKYSVRINTFGLSMLQKKNPITGRIHTKMRQCEAITGRFQSGGGKEGERDKINIQNIPKEKEIRECFVAPKGYSFTTLDLTGAEVVIMASKAQDKELIRMALVEGDIHSPLAQRSWRAVGKLRSKMLSVTMQNLRDRGEIIPEMFMEDHKKSVELANIVISPEANKPIRSQFKSCTFGTVYGMSPKKCAKTLNIKREEGKLVIETIRAAIPKTFQLVEGNVNTALHTGYLVLNKRTNSRIWFLNVIKKARNKVPLDYSDTMEVDGVARNAPFQGTQADMLKEAIVEIGRQLKEWKIPSRLVLTVHDELGYINPVEYDGESEEFRRNPHLVEYIPKTPETVNLAVIKDEQLRKKYEQQLKEHNKIDVPLPHFQALKMTEVANRYLVGLKMSVDFHTLPYWTK